MQRAYYLPIIFLTCIVTFISIRQGSYGYVPLVSWVVSIILSCIYFLDANLNKPKILPQIVITIVLAAAIIKVLFLIFTPYSSYFHGDEAIISRNAKLNYQKFLQGHPNFLGSELGAISTWPAIWFFIQGGVIHLLGPSIFSLKLFAIFTDILIALFVYGIVTIKLPKIFGIFSLLLYTTFPISVHFSMTGYQNLQSTLFFLLSLYCLLLAFSNQKLTSSSQNQLFFSGLFAALSFYFYFSAYVVLPIIFLLTLVNSKFKNILQTLTSVFSGFIIGIYPYLTFALFQFNFLASRKDALIGSRDIGSLLSFLYSQAVILLSGFLPGGKMNGSGLHYPDLPGISNWVIAVMIVIGFLVGLKLHRRLILTFFVSCLAILVFGGVLTESPPASQRLIHLYPIFIIITTFGLYYLQLLHRQISLTLILVCILTILNLHHFLTRNLAVYQQFLPRDVVDTVSYLSSGSNLLLFSAPIHKKDQLYFYSQGKLDPIVVSNCQDLSGKFTKNFQSFFLFIDSENNWLKKCENLNITQVKYWPTGFNKTSLYKLEL